MFPSFCGAIGLAGWVVTLLVWAALVSLVVWGIARLFPSRRGEPDREPPPGEELERPLARSDRR